MTKFEIEDPEIYETKKVDSSGKIYIGKEYANMNAKILIERFEEIEEEE